ncbi:hypothetical protein crov179 [Cafeteria roenbergensis virus]|uniref:Uncharacterized protein n=1 Tax=Cafeteria roenbergensis virus (strain BV-PW1) TaxID=693272 RepID=E3T4U9_CROVB|nr:hypothetical protein crov179 [Cafeteria roenbergensis virus BV-PW1]ADO67212.1 hypothetical protein crov179 [Cafeteria roenbergensis virus BV-PW1]
MGYYLQVNSLIGCPYSIEVEKILQQENINSKIIKINPSEKHLYKNEQISSFPQIFLKKYNSKGQLLLGGNSDFKEILNLQNKDLNIQIKSLLKKYPVMTHKTKLRLIQLFNKV